MMRVKLPGKQRLILSSLAPFKSSEYEQQPHVPDPRVSIPNHGPEHPEHTLSAQAKVLFHSLAACSDPLIRLSSLRYATK